MPACAAIYERLQEHCSVRICTSEKHIELRDARKNRVSRDLVKFVDWLRDRSPFNVDQQKLMSLSCGVKGVASDNASEVSVCLLKNILMRANACNVVALVDFVYTAIVLHVGKKQELYDTRYGGLRHAAHFPVGTSKNKCDWTPKKAKEQKLICFCDIIRIKSLHRNVTTTRHVISVL